MLSDASIERPQVVRLEEDGRGLTRTMDPCYGIVDEAEVGGVAEEVLEADFEDQVMLRVFLQPCRLVSCSQISRGPPYGILALDRGFAKSDPSLRPSRLLGGVIKTISSSRRQTCSPAWLTSGAGCSPRS
jgi:hypothetical protein